MTRAPSSRVDTPHDVAHTSSRRCAPACVCVCVCVWVGVWVWVCVCVCVDTPHDVAHTSSRRCAPVCVCGWVCGCGCACAWASTPPTTSPTQAPAAAHVGGCACVRACVRARARVRACVSLSVCLCLCLSVPVSVCACLSLAGCLAVFLSVWLCVSVRVGARARAYPSVCRWARLRVSADEGESFAAAPPVQAVRVCPLVRDGRRSCVCGRVGECVQNRHAAVVRKRCAAQERRGTREARYEGRGMGVGVVVVRGGWSLIPALSPPPQT